MRINLFFRKENLLSNFTYFVKAAVKYLTQIQLILVLLFPHLHFLQQQNLSLLKSVKYLDMKINPVQLVAVIAQMHSQERSSVVHWHQIQ